MTADTPEERAPRRSVPEILMANPELFEASDDGLEEEDIVELEEAKKLLEEATKKVYTPPETPEAEKPTTEGALAVKTPAAEEPKNDS